MPSAAIAQVLRLHRAQLFGIIELRGVHRMRDMYAQAQGDLADKLSALRRRHRDDSFDAHHMRQVLMQVNDGIRVLDQKLDRHLEETGRLAGTLAQRHLMDAVKKFEKHFTGSTPVIQTDQAGVLQKLHRGVEPSLLNRYKASVRLYGKPTIASVRQHLTQSLLQNETVDQAVDRVVGAEGAFAGQRWRAERIVRTELSYTYGVVKQVSMQRLVAVDLPDLQKRLVATHDARTGEDSLELDGQTVAVGKPFKWKDHKGHVVEYMQPPNRPNDREVVIPWRPGWAASAVPEAGPVTPTAPPA